MSGTSSIFWRMIRWYMSPVASSFAFCRCNIGCSSSSIGWLVPAALSALLFILELCRSPRLDRTISPLSPYFFGRLLGAAASPHAGNGRFLYGHPLSRGRHGQRRDGGWEVHGCRPVFLAAGERARKTEKGTERYERPDVGCARAFCLE